MKRLYVAIIMTLACVTYAVQAMGASLSITVGVVESSSGGFKFPDGTVQLSASLPPCTAITTVPTTISVEGVYCFTGHLSTSMTSGIAITISADNVTINMNGWKLDGLGAGTATLALGIFADRRKNITIRNGTVRGFMVGISLNDVFPYDTTSQGHLVEEIRADKNTLAGIWVEGSGNIVHQNQVIDTGGSTVTCEPRGIILRGPGSRLLYNDIIGVATSTCGDLSPANGLDLFKADGAVVKGNRVHDITGNGGEPGIGIWISTSNNVLVVGNRITNVNSTAVDRGIAFSSSTGKYMDNLTSGVTIPFTGGTAVGTNN